MRRILAGSVLAATLWLPSSVAATVRGPQGGQVLRPVHLEDPLMVTAALHGPAVVVDPHGTVTLLAWHTLRPLKVLHGFVEPEVAAIAPGDRYAYVSDAGSGDVSVIDLDRRRLVRHVFVGYQAHHLDFSPDGKRLWVALGETASTIVRLDTSSLRRPRVVGRIHPRVTAHGIEFSPNGRTG